MLGDSGGKGAAVQHDVQSAGHHGEGVLWTAVQYAAADGAGCHIGHGADAGIISARDRGIIGERVTETIIIRQRHPHQ